MKNRPDSRMKPAAAGKRRRARAVSLLKAGASLAAAVFIWWPSGPKLPPTACD